MGELNNLGVLYDKDIDYLEVIRKGLKNYRTESDEFLSLFVSEKDNNVIGFSLEEATQNLHLLSKIHPRIGLAGLIKMARKLEGWSQEQMQQETGVSLRTIQRAEAGEANISLDNLFEIITAFPKYDFSVLLKPEERTLKVG